jgi:hypothetical protein
MISIRTNRGEERTQHEQTAYRQGGEQHQSDRALDPVVGFHPGPAT